MLLWMIALLICIVNITIYAAIIICNDYIWCDSTYMVMLCSHIYDVVSCMWFVKTPMYLWSVEITKLIV